MLETVFLIVFAMIGLSLLLNLWRLVVGPSVPDRILALDTMYINTIALIILYGMSMGTGLYFEAALLIAMLGFVSTVAVCKYLLRGDIIESRVIT
jgi:multicomponent K+:H+ antiporter subunit F